MIHKDAFLNISNNPFIAASRTWTVVFGSGKTFFLKEIHIFSLYRIEGSAMSLSSKRSMTDADGKFLGIFDNKWQSSIQPDAFKNELKSPGAQVAGYQKKLLSMHATAYITVQEGGAVKIPMN